ncbi:cytochrome ubiquinol oxidase subunit I, partial [Rhodococcus hoagii]|nr:cytochrome ubiquinol oxidase subunit I [Prescottella equi]
MLALLMRAELAVRGCSSSRTSSTTSLHDARTIMLLLYATPIVFGFAKLHFCRCRSAAPDVAFPRLNAFSYGPICSVPHRVCGLHHSGRCRRLRVDPIHAAERSTPLAGHGRQTGDHGPGLSGSARSHGGVNMITTVICLRAPGMTMFRMPIFTWNIFITSILILVAFPDLTADSWACSPTGWWAPTSTTRPRAESCCGSILFWFFGH